MSEILRMVGPNKSGFFTPTQFLASSQYNVRHHPIEIIVITPNRPNMECEANFMAKPAKLHLFWLSPQFVHKFRKCVAIKAWHFRHFSSHRSWQHYPLVNSRIAMENHHPQKRFINCQWKAILVYQRVYGHGSKPWYPNVNIKIDGIYGCSSTQIWYNRDPWPDDTGHQGCSSNFIRVTMLGDTAWEPRNLHRAMFFSELWDGGVFFCFW